MTQDDLNRVVEQRMSDPMVLGRIACNLRSSEVVTQRHHDELSFRVSWEDDGDYWRCRVVDASTQKTLVQVDLHENQTVRADAFAPCRVTVSPEENLLCVTRYKAAQ